MREGNVLLALDRLVHSERSRAAAAHPGRTAECPPWATLAAGRLSPPQRTHVRGCARCAMLISGRPVRRSSATLHSLSLSLAAAGACAVALLAGSIGFPTSAPERFELRSQAAPLVVFAKPLEAPTPPPLPPAGLTLRGGPAVWSSLGVSPPPLPLQALERYEPARNNAAPPVRTALHAPPPPPLYPAPLSPNPAVLPPLGVESVGLSSL